MSACDRCGGDLDTGDHGIGCCPLERGRHRRATSDVTWAGGKTFENLGHEPVTFYDKSSYTRYLKAHGISEFVRHVPVPGSDKSPHTTSWAGVSQYTLDGAKAMLERSGKASDAPAPSYIQSMTVTISEESGAVTEAPC